jgi:hypothetical protein
MVDHDLLCHERDLLEEILNDDNGHLPIVLTADEPTAVHLPAGLHTEIELIPTAETVPL